VKAALDVDGIASGCALNLALEALMEVDAVPGTVAVGKEAPMSGPHPGRRAWAVRIRDPFSEESFSVIEIFSGVV
jgi:thiamine biosynthesis lipoprotein ApbE